MEAFAFNTKYIQEPQAYLEVGEYHADRSTRLVVHDELGEQLSTVTVCMLEYNLSPAKGYVFIKDYGENEGTVEALHEAGIIEQPLRYFDAGYAKDGVAYCRLTDKVEV